MRHRVNFFTGIALVIAVACGKAQAIDPPLRANQRSAPQFLTAFPTALTTDSSGKTDTVKHLICESRTARRLGAGMPTQDFVNSDDGKLTYVSSSLWNDVYDVRVRGDFAYCIMTWGLLTLDVSDPQFPTPVDQYFLNTWPAWDAGSELLGNYLLVAYGQSGLHIFDITRPDRPVLVSRQSTAGQCREITIDGSLGLISDGGNGIVFMDFSDPSHPEFLANYPLLHFVKEVAVSGHIAYVANDSFFMTLDISNIQSVVRLDSMYTYPPCEGVSISGNTALLSRTDRLSVINASDPTNVVYSGQALVPDVARHALPIQNYALVANSSAGVSVVNLANMNAPKVVYELPTEGGVADIVIQDTFAYLAAASGGCEIVSIGQLPTLSSVGQYIPSKNVADVEVKNSFAYVANELDGFRILDMANAHRPAVLGSLALPGHAWRLQMVGNLVYVVSRSTGGLFIVDCNDPNLPVLIGQYFRPDLTWDVWTDGTSAYLLTSNSQLLTVDVSDPSAPTLQDSYTLPIPAYTLTGNDSLLIVGELDRLQVFRRIQGNSPLPLGSCSVAQMPFEMQEQGDLIYLADYGSGLVIVDVADPQAPEVIGSIGDLGGEARDVCIADGMAVVANGSGGIVVLDVSNPTSPAITARFEIGGLASGVAMNGSFVVSALWYGLGVFALYENSFVRGDANNDTQITISDVILLINYLFKGGPEPVPAAEAGDANCDGSIELGDALALINHVFKSGMAPACR